VAREVLPILATLSEKSPIRLRAGSTRSGPPQYDDWGQSLEFSSGGNDMANAVQLKVNGVVRSFDGDPETPMLWYLRDTLGLTGTKFGCGVGLCGACTVHKNGDAIRACITPMSSLAGAEIRTIEDIGSNGLHPVQKMWVQFNVPQCGYCQSGQIMQAIALLKKKPRATDEDIDEGMAANICRCGTYQRIRAAIKAAAQESE
jgi:isoquinoline 1-oxidoreductase alpha subunit